MVPKGAGMPHRAPHSLDRQAPVDPPKPLDRRVRRTKRRLKEALLELIEERDYDGITVQDIADRADVGRSTFYSHYGSKEDLLFSGFDRWLLSLTEAAPTRGASSEAAPTPASTSIGGPPATATRTMPSETGPDAPDPVPTAPFRAPFRFSLPLLRHIRSQRRFFLATIVSGSNPRVRRKTTALMVEMARRELERIPPSSPGSGETSRPRALEAGVEDEAEWVREARAHGVVGAFLGLVTWWLRDGESVSADAVERIFQGLFAR